MNNTQRHNAKDFDLVMRMLILTEYTDNYSKTSGSSWQYYRDEPSFTNAGVIDGFLGNSASFKFKQKKQVMVPLQYLSCFWRTLEIPLINCKVNLIPTWFDNCVLNDTNTN